MNSVELKVYVNTDDLTNKKIPRYIAVRKSINAINFDNDLNVLKSLIYLSLDTEYNARIAQLFIFLRNLNSDDKDFMYINLINSDTYEKYNHLETFNSINFLNHIINMIGVEATIFEINKLNKQLIDDGVNKLKSYRFIKIVNESELKLYLFSWEKVFKQKNKKHLLKMKSMIDEVIKDRKHGDKSDWIAEDNFDIKFDKRFFDL